MTAVPHSTSKSAMGSSITTFSKSAHSGVIFSTSLPLSFIFSDVPSVTMIHVSLNCRATEFCNPSDHQCFPIIAFTLDAVLLVLDVNVFTKIAMPPGPYPS